MQSKQQYLRKEIIDKGYDAMDFTEYLEHQKQNGKIVIVLS